jgi:hypothetical protein
MLSEDGHIAALRGPTHEYKEHISVCRVDGLGTKFAVVFSRAILNELVKANFVKQDGPENERQVTIFRLTNQGRRIAKLSIVRPASKLKASLKAKLLSLGYPWPDYLEDKSIAWLKTEIAANDREVSKNGQN